MFLFKFAEKHACPTRYTTKWTILALVLLPSTSSMALALNALEILLLMLKSMLAAVPQVTPTRVVSVLLDAESMKSFPTGNAAALLDTTLSTASVGNVTGIRFMTKVLASAESLVTLNASTT